MTTLTQPIASPLSTRHNYLGELAAIIKLAFPMLVTQLGVSAVGFIDTMMAGHYSNTALAGAAVGASIGFPCIIALNGVMMAVTPITAQLTGAGKLAETGPKVKQALWLGLVLAALLFAVFGHTDTVLRMMKLDSGVVSVAKGYIAGLSLGLPAVAGYFVLKSFVEGLGDTKPQMVISVITVAFNYVANDILIHGKWGLPELGGAGCGYASGLTFWVSFICILGYTLVNEKCRKTGVFSALSLPSAKGIMEILQLGLPIGATIFMECSIFACITLFIGVLGPLIVGGHQITLNYSGLVFAFPLSIGMSITIRAGHAIGRKDPEAARFACIMGCALAVGISLLTLAFTRLFSHEIVAVYTKDPEVSAIAVSLLKIGALYQVSDAIMTTSQGALRGYKDANMTLLLTFTAYWVITLPLGYVLAMTDLVVPALGAKGFWLSLIAGLTISGLLLSSRLYRVSGKHIKKQFRDGGHHRF
ncbi:MAG: MATE family efflux transporter [Desulfobacteraceae bacterium]|nr:MATE family efflux transporter [Desulfobacteraceae bacterium]